VSQPALLALEDGSLFRGTSVGTVGQAVGEVVFNTSITGYQEILTDPSYCQQIVTLTYPHIGNVGTNSQDEESNAVYASGLVIRDLPVLWSNWRAQESLADYLRRKKVVAIAGVDTRRLTRVLREEGAQRGCIIGGNQPDEAAAVAAARAFPGLKGADLARVVSTKEPYEWERGSWRSAAPSKPSTFHVVAYDFGIKWHILDLLVDRGCRVTVVPATTPATEILAKHPDGVFLSNGPGDPEPCEYAIQAIREFLAADLPVFGICLGHQLLALACGAKTVKMKFGHHGANHPVQDLETGKVIITTQNHGFAVALDSLPDSVQATHRSLFDGSLQGIRHKRRPAFGFQGHPEGSPGPHDVRPLFEHFIDLMASHRARSQADRVVVVSDA
jgi:carbamoyl-phosphate synthase small subunit